MLGRMPENPTNPRRWLTRTARRGRRAVILVVAVALSAVGVVRAASAAANDPLARFHRQAFAWHGCRLDPTDEVGAALDRAGAQCGQVSVPLDYRKPDGRTVTVAIYRVRATDAAQRRGVLMV